MKYYKVLTDNFTHHDYTYKIGLNVLQSKFDSNPDCAPDGFYVCELQDVVHWLTLHNNNKYIAEVELCPDSIVVPGHKKIKTNKLVLDSVVLIEDFLEQYGLVKRAIEIDGMALRYVKNQTPEMCLEAVRQNGYALEFVKDQTPEICLQAVRQKGCALQYVKNQTPEICLEAVRRSCHAFQYVKNQTLEICLEAVRRSCHAFQYVKNQTLEICLEAIRQDSYALKFVKNQTPEYRDWETDRKSVV